MARATRTHPADVTADRLIHHYEKWWGLFDGKERDALHLVVERLRKIADPRGSGGW